MGTVRELLECAEHNMSSGVGGIGQMLAKAQIKQYRELKDAGADDEDDVDESLEKYPECRLKL